MKWLIVLVFATGCTVKGKVATGTVMSAVGGALILSTKSEDCSEKEWNEAIGCGIEETGAASLGTGLLIAGVGFLVAAAVTYEDDTRPAMQPLAITPGAPMATPHGEMLQRLTLQAGVAARAGRCTSVEEIARHVEQLDTAYRNGAFLLDVHVAGCL